MEPQKEIGLKLNNYENKGLYLIFHDSSRLSLTKENIEQVAKMFWEDPTKILLEVKESGEFQKCSSICPLRDEEGMCNALYPVLPFLEVLDKYVSFDKLIAIYKGDEKELLHISDSTMQEALKYISILSLTHYCQGGKKYEKYYFGIIPLMNPKEVAIRLYLNIYLLHKGKKEEINSFISKFNEEIRIASQNQVKRLSLICKNDAFLNAFVNTQLATEILSMDIEKSLQESFDKFEAGRIPSVPISKNNEFDMD